MPRTPTPLLALGLLLLLPAGASAQRVYVAGEVSTDITGYSIAADGSQTLVATESMEGEYHCVFHPGMTARLTVQ